MQTQHRVTLTGNCRAGIAIFDQTVLPEVLTIDGQQAFRFSYKNGES